MARIRSLKPEFWDDRKLARSTSRDARMLYMGMWNQSDEHGRLNGDAAWLKGRVFPFEDDISADTVLTLLQELEQAERILSYEVDGDPFIYLPKLPKHQRLEPSKVESRLPEPPSRVEQSAPDLPPHADKSAPRADEPAQGADESALLYVAGSMEQGAGSRDARAPTTARGTRIPDAWTPDPKLVDEMRSEGIPDEVARRELPKFRDYWDSQPGAKGRKTNWSATWRNWLRRSMENEPRTSNGKNPQSDSGASFQFGVG